jgi:hypothetical protein
MYMKKIWKNCFRQKNQLFLLLLLLTIILGCPESSERFCGILFLDIK